MVLPERPSDVLLKDTHYGDVVLQCVLADVFRHKTQIHEYKLALFGGSTTLCNASDYENSVGSRNVTYMRYVVENARIQIISATVMDWRGGEASC